MSADVLRRMLAAPIESGWRDVLLPVMSQVSQMADFIEAEVAAGRRCLPDEALILRAFVQPFADVRILVVGQDPYPTPGHPRGLAFCLERSVRPLPPSLKNVYRELGADLGIEPPEHGDLTPWARQGVLLLNRCLTLQVGLPGSHRGKGWETVTDQVAQALAAREAPLVSILWGADAQTLRPLLRDYPIIESAHPSAMTARDGFFGSRPFSQANARLVDQAAPPIDWVID